MPDDQTTQQQQPQPDATPQASAGQQTPGGQPGTPDEGRSSGSATAGPSHGAGGPDQQSAADATAKPPAEVVLQIPPAATGWMDEEDLAEATRLAKDAGWTQQEAEAFLAEQVALRQQTAARLLAQLQAHPEVGGSRLAATQVAVQRVLDRFLPASSPEGAALRRNLNKTGLGNYPPLVVLLARIGQAMAEDQVPVGHAAGRTRAAEEVLYGADRRA